MIKYMKKSILVLAVFSFVIMAVVSGTFAKSSGAGNTVNTSALNASADGKTKVVTISGTISSGSGQQVTVKVINPNGTIDYIDQEATGSNGSYLFSYTLDGNVKGIYEVFVSGTDFADPQETTFEYKPGNKPDDLPRNNGKKEHKP